VDFSRLSSQIDAISGKLTNLGGSLSLAAAPFEAFEAIAVNAFSDFETGIAKIGNFNPYRVFFSVVTMEYPTH